MRHRLAVVPAVVLMMSSLVACGGDSGGDADDGIGLVGDLGGHRDR